MLLESASSFRPQPPSSGSTWQSRKISFCPFAITKLRTFELASTAHPKQSHTSSLKFSLVYKKNASHSAAGALCHESRHSTSWENLACPSHQIPILLLFTPSITSFCASHRKYGVCAHSWSQWVSDSQLPGRRYSVSSWCSWPPDSQPVGRSHFGVERPFHGGCLKTSGNSDIYSTTHKQ